MCSEIIEAMMPEVGLLKNLFREGRHIRERYPMHAFSNNDLLIATLKGLKAIVDVTTL
jgi:hypothetical protein